MEFVDGNWGLSIDDLWVVFFGKVLTKCMHKLHNLPKMPLILGNYKNMPPNSFGIQFSEAVAIRV